jgi:hypothetical protein
LPARRDFTPHPGGARRQEDLVKVANWMIGTLLGLSAYAQGAGSDPTAAAVQNAGQPAVLVAQAAKPATKPTDPAMPSMQREKLEEESATVESIDPATRMLGLRAEDGSTGAFQAGPEVRNFAQIHVGDKVVVSYYRGIAANVVPKGSVPLNKVNQVDLSTRAEPGAQPHAGVGTALQASVVIEKIDTKANTVTFKRPDGLSRTLPVESPEGREFIRKLKVGDTVDVVYAEALAVEVRPKK